MRIIRVNTGGSTWAIRDGSGIYLNTWFKGLDAQESNLFCKASHELEISVTPASEGVLLSGDLSRYRELIRELGPSTAARDLKMAIKNYLSNPVFRIRGVKLEAPAVMGILNLTPDSFSGDGTFGTEALERTRRMAAEGASILDVGGESTRPGHTPTSPKEEEGRVVPFLQSLKDEGINVPISIDTTKLQIVKKTRDLVDIINDQWGLQMRGRENEKLAKFVALSGKSIILMHNWGMGAGHVYDGPDIMDEVISFLKRSIEIAEGGGIDPERIMVDPGIGFGKGRRQNLEVIKRIGELRVLGKPILVGASKKSFLGKKEGLDPSERLEGTLAVTAYALSQGASVVRVHNVRENRRAAKIIEDLLRA